jgi:hypothetical protein
MKKIICDSCKKEILFEEYASKMIFKKYNKIFISIPEAGQYTTTRYDICHKCIEKFCEIIEKELGKEEEEENEYIIFVRKEGDENESK